MELNGTPPKPKLVEQPVLQPAFTELEDFESKAANPVLIKRTRAQMAILDNLGNSHQRNVYADKQEKSEMEACGPSCITILKQQLKKLNGHSRGRALDVAGGDGRVAKELLLYEYETVDLFDQCQKGV